MNKFSIKSFHELFLPFWRRFISHPDTQKALPEIKQSQATEQQPAQAGIQLGEFFEFFWNLKDGGQLMNYNGGFESPRSPKVEEVLDNNLPTMSQLTAEFSNALGVSLENLTKEIEEIRQHIQANLNNQNSQMWSEIQQLRQSLADLSQDVYRLRN